MREALGPVAWDALEAAASSASDEEALKALEALKDVPEGAKATLLATLDGKQQAVIGTLQYAVMQRAKML